ncbi:MULTISPECIES: flagellar hook protein FlgE [Stutzerimonas stutzeri subgroup]|jgi:flagellar hook protein FlgE|uniref:flagellar hook protein FlgE n=1 Tax=Stutzerimonas stutzeri subgroup TaxID=578833 RepID=UPI000C4C56BA|nr:MULTISPECIES: flagellar hook protein FlgE [Stutzerimonas stutzeri subgroup]MAK88208.1 flagellar hook protein FlgE [Pseudomonas sp.]MBU0921559.1 flagellar hook protein FlgE [Gammaproteobacteria bacterium]UEG60334.1 flagellar hook protein FlgE [Stutzerimonas chloritidismutans]
MSFNIGLSGMRAASKDLNVTGNNIANAGTAGFKQSRAEFADVYASSMGVSKNAVGSGVQLANISQQFTQGNINYTQNALDLAINGKGFFQVSNNGALSYTRAGYFGTDREGFLVDNFGYNLQGYTVNEDGNLQDTIGNLRIQSGSQEPKATTKIEQTFNLNSTNTAPSVATFNPADPQTYNSSTSTNIYDSQGNAHVMTQYFVKSDANNWDMHVLIDGRTPGNAAAEPPVAAVIPLSFTPSGQLDKAALSAATLPSGFDETDGIINYSGWDPAGLDTTVSPPVWESNGAVNPSPFAIDIRNATQYSSAFAVNSINQDGYTAGELAGLEIDEGGQIFARYTNGQSMVQGRVVLATFANEQGLTPVGKTQWVQSFESGEPVRNPPGVGTMGALQSGALEDSNVELSDQLVNLIVAQRNYQANAKTIETESAITQTIINLR